MASAWPPNDPDGTLLDVLEAGEHISETAPCAPGCPPNDIAININAPIKKTRFEELTIDMDFSPKPGMARTDTHFSAPIPVDNDEYEFYDAQNVLPYSGVLVPESQGKDWPWSQRHRFEIFRERSPGELSCPSSCGSLFRFTSTRRTGREIPDIPIGVAGGGLVGLEPPEARVKRVVQLMVWGEQAEAANGYMILTLVALAVGSFGGDLSPLSFWLINAVALLEVALKLLRNWSDAFVGVKCCDVASQWDAFWGLKWSIRTRALAVLVQLGLYGAEVWNVVTGDQGLGNTRDQVEKVLTAFLLLHWVFGTWVLIMELHLFVASKIKLRLLVPGFGARSFPEVMTALGLGLTSCVSGVMCGAFRSGKWGDVAGLFDWVSDMGDNPYGLEGLPALTWYVHSRRHPMLRGYAAMRSEECGLEVDWTLDFKELIDLFWRCHQGMIRVSPSAQKWALDVINERVEKGEDRWGRGAEWEDQVNDLDGLVLLDAVLVIPKGQEKIFKALTAKVAKLLVDRGVVKRSLEKTMRLALAGSERQKELNRRAMERLAQRLMMLGEKLEDLQKWETALMLHDASLTLRTESKAGAEGLARSLTCVAWTMAMVYSGEEKPKRSFEEVQEGLKAAEEYARKAVSVGQAGDVGNRDMGMHLATLAHVLKKMGRTDEEQAALHEEAERLWTKSKGEENRMKEKSKYDFWRQCREPSPEFGRG